jgi:hypothetical protein
MPTDKLPAVHDIMGDLPAVFEPPTAFEVVDRGAAETINFETLGDTMTAIFEGLEEVTLEEGELINLARFTGPDGKPYAVFPNEVLRRGLAKVEAGRWVRITLTSLVDTGKPSPLKSYTVEVGR